MKYSTQTLLAAIAFAVGPGAQAADPAAGQAKSAICAACHGPKGIAVVPTYPNLAGQKEQYLVEAIKAYKSGARTNPIMKPMVDPLSDADVANLAAYYASLDCK